MEKKEEHLTDIMAGDNVKKKRITTILLEIIILTLVIVGTCLIIFQIVKNEEESKGLTFYLPRSNSFASNWVYEMSEQDILKEREHQYLYALVGGDYQYWEFEAVGEGEVTIEYTAQYQLEVVEEKCFSVTYYVDEDGTIVIDNSIS